jgi:hypothetical protein
MSITIYLQRMETSFVVINCRKKTTINPKVPLAEMSSADVWNCINKTIQERSRIDLNKPKNNHKCTKEELTLKKNGYSIFRVLLPTTSFHCNGGWIQNEIVSPEAATTYPFKTAKTSSDLVLYTYVEHEIIIKEKEPKMPTRFINFTMAIPMGVMKSEEEGAEELFENIVTETVKANPRVLELKGRIIGISSIYMHEGTPTPNLFSNRWCSTFVNMPT